MASCSISIREARKLVLAILRQTTRGQKNTTFAVLAIVVGWGGRAWGWGGGEYHALSLLKPHTQPGAQGRGQGARKSQAGAGVTLQ